MRVEELTGPWWWWWWFSGQRTRLLLRRVEKQFTIRTSMAKDNLAWNGLGIHAMKGRLQSICGLVLFFD